MELAKPDVRLVDDVTLGLLRLGGDAVFRMWRACSQDLYCDDIIGDVGMICLEDAGQGGRSNSFTFGDFILIQLAVAGNFDRLALPQVKQGVSIGLDEICLCLLYTSPSPRDS